MDDKTFQALKEMTPAERTAYCDDIIRSRPVPLLLRAAVAGVVPQAALSSWVTTTNKDKIIDEKKRALVQALADFDARPYEPDDSVDYVELMRNDVAESQVRSRLR